MFCAMHLINLKKEINLFTLYLDIIVHKYINVYNIKV